MWAIGGVAVAISGLVPWISELGYTEDAFSIPLGFIADEYSEAGPNIGVVMMGCGIAITLLAVATRAAWFRRIIAFVSLVTILAFYTRYVQLRIDEFGMPVGETLGSVGAGLYIAAAGSFVQLFGRAPRP